MHSVVLVQSLHFIVLVVLVVSLLILRIIVKFNFNSCVVVISSFGYYNSNTLAEK